MDKTIHLLFEYKVTVASKEYSFNELRVGPITGRSNRVAMNKELFESNQTTTKLLGTLIKVAKTTSGEEVELNEKAVDRLHSHDRIMVIIESWKLTYGKDEFHKLTECDKCEKQIAIKYNFSEPTRPPAGYDGKVEVLGHNVEVTLADGRTEKQISNSMKNTESTGDYGDLHKTALESFVVSVDGEKFVYDDAPMNLISALSDVMKSEEMAFGYETVIEVECHKCGHVDSYAASVQDIDFLFNQAGKETAL